jgi:hypothetical protein
LVYFEIKHIKIIENFMFFLVFYFTLWRKNTYKDIKYIADLRFFMRKQFLGHNRVNVPIARYSIVGHHFKIAVKNN